MEIRNIQANHTQSASPRSPPRCHECGETECTPETSVSPEQSEQALSSRGVAIAKALPMKPECEYRLADADNEMHAHITILAGVSALMYRLNLM